MQMEKLLVNVSLFFSEVALIQIFGFLAHPMDGSLMLFFQCLRRAMRRATFLSWRGCYLHGKMLYACSQSSSHRISQGSLTEKAFLLNVSLRFLLNNIRSNHWLTTQVFNFQMLGHFPVLIQEGKKGTVTSFGLYEKESSTGDLLEWEHPNTWSVPQSAAPRNKDSVGWTDA